MEGNKLRKGKGTGTAQKRRRSIKGGEEDG